MTRAAARGHNMFGHHQCDFPKDAIEHNYSVPAPILLKFSTQMYPDMAKAVLKRHTDPFCKKRFTPGFVTSEVVSCSSPPPSPSHIFYAEYLK